MKKWLSASFLTNSEKLRGALIVIVLGVFMGRESDLFHYIFLAGVLLAFTSLIIKNYWLFLTAIFSLSLSYGQVYNHFLFEKNGLEPFYGEEVVLGGVVKSFPEYKEKSTQVIFEVEKVVSQGDEKIFEIEREKILLSVLPEEALRYGDQLLISGKLTKPHGFGDFDYSEFLKKYGAQSLMRFPSNIEKSTRVSSQDFFLRGAESVRNYSSSIIEAVLPPPHSYIGMGILLGVKKQFPEFIAQDLKNASLQHIIVVSGFNVTVIIFLIVYLLRRSGRVIVFLGVLLSVFFFVAMTGMEAPVLRAGLMGALVALSTAIGRFSDMRNVFFFALAMVALFAPETLQYDLSLFLSSAATLGIVLGTPYVEKCLFFIPERLELRMLFSVTITAQLAVMPLLGIYFSDISPIGFFSNVFVEPLIPIGMFFVFLILITGGVTPIIFSKIIAIPAFLVIEIIFWVAHSFGATPLVSFPSSVAMFFLVLVILFFLWGSLSRNAISQNFDKNKTREVT